MLSPSDFGDLLQFVAASARSDVRRSALGHLLDTTGSKEGAAEFERDGARLAIALAALAADESVPDGDRRSALRALTNACAESAVVARLLACSEAGRRLLLSGTATPLSADRCRLAVNVTACQPACEALFDGARVGDAELARCLAHWVDSFTSPTCAHWSLSGAAVMNGTGAMRVRRSLCNGADPSQLSRVAAVVTSTEGGAAARRPLALAVVRNCCFDTELHAALCRDNGVLLSLLYPVAAGDMRIADSELEDVMAELQYLPADKIREPDAELRTTVLEAIYQLCATRCGRERCRAAGAYYVLREWHKGELEPTLDKLLYDLINVLIRKEDEMGADNLKEVQLDDGGEGEETR